MAPENNPPRLVYRMPFMLMASMGVYAAMAVVFGLSIITAPLGLNLMNYRVDGVAVGGIEFLRQSAFVVVPGTVLYAVVAHALWAERSWGREAIMAAQFFSTTSLWFWTLWNNSLEAAVDSILSPVALLVASGWYLYGKASVRTYYRAIGTARVQVPPVAEVPSGHGV